MKQLKKILSLMLILIMCFSVVPMTDMGIEASAASNLKILGVDIGIVPGTHMQFSTESGSNSESGYYYKGKYLGASQCFGFARWCQYKLFGSISLGNYDKSYKDNSSKDFYWVSVDGVSSVKAGKLTTSNLKTLINASKPGAHLRTNENSNGTAHSMIITEITNTGFSIAQCNGSNNNEYSSYKQNYVGTYTYTWSSYVSSTYGSRGIAYIEMPYVYSYNEVEKEDFTEYALNASFKVTASSKTVRKLPYASGTKVKTVNHNDTITVKAYLYNKYENLWYKTTDGNYIHCENLSYVDGDALPPSNCINAKFKVMCSSKPIRKEPTSSSDKLSSVSQNETITVTGYVYNESGILWYVCSDGYISHNYLSVVSTDKRTPSNYIDETLNVKAAKTVKKKPAGSSDKVSDLAKGSTLKVHGYLYNKYGNLWYLTSDGYYTYNSYLEQSKSSSSAPSNYVARDFKLTDDKNAKDEPYSVSAKSRSISKGSTVSTVGYVINLYGNTWYLTKDGDYLSESNLSCVHSYTSSVTKAATCTATGTKTFTCKYCNNKYTETIAKTSHTIVTDKAVAATCTKTGLTEGKHCSVCGTVTVAQQTVAKKSHNSNTTIPAVAATCTKTGLTEGKKCSVCGTVTVAQQTVAKKAHNSNTKIPAVAATCTKTGLTEGKKCSVCGTVTVAQQTVAKKAHNSNTTISAVAATCTKTGLTEGKKCSVCGTVTVAQQTVAKKSHIDNNGDYKCDYGCGYAFEKPAPDTPTTPDEPENKPCSCNCHKGGIAGFFFRIINFFQKLFGMNKICECGAKH